MGYFIILFNFFLERGGGILGVEILVQLFEDQELG